MRNTLPHKPKKNEAAIVNLDSTRGQGTHWVCYKKYGNTVHYFDSFGDLRPPLEMMEYFKDCKVLYNYDRKQLLNTVVCGHLCIEFLLHDIQ